MEKIQVSSVVWRENPDLRGDTFCFQVCIVKLEITVEKSRGVMYKVAWPLKVEMSRKELTVMSFWSENSYELMKST